MQLDLFSVTETEPTEPKYFYTVTWEQKNINPKTLTHETTTSIKTAQAVYTSIEQVREIVLFIQQTYSYTGCHIVTRHTTPPNLNYLSQKPYIL